MVIHTFFKYFSNICRDLKRRGFTLAEALIVSVMAGYCILPILGSMQNASNRADAYDHHTKMVRYTRSRLNQELANGGFDHRMVDTSVRYHYLVDFDRLGNPENAKPMEISDTPLTIADIRSVDATGAAPSTTVSSAALRLFGFTGSMSTAYVNVIHAYKTEVEINDSPFIASYSVEEPTGDYNYAPKGLMAVIASTRLIESNGISFDDDGRAIGPDGTPDEGNIVSPVAYFSMVNLPTVSDEFIWMADAANMKLIGIDPISKMTATTIDLPRSTTKPNNPGHSDNDPYRPWHIAVHPTAKMIAVMRKSDILLVNIDRKSTGFGQWKPYLELPSSEAYCDPNIDGTKASEDGGLVFRPDGKYLFASRRKDPFIVVGSLDYSLDTAKKVLKWTDESPSMTRKTEVPIPGNSYIVTGLLAGGDGNLYVAIKDKKTVQRFPMYPSAFDADWKGEYFLFEGSEKSGAAGDPLGGPGAVDSKDIKSIAISPDGRRLAVVTDEHVKVFDTTDKTLIGYVTKVAFNSDGDNKNSPNKAFFSTNSSAGKDIGDITNFLLNVSSKRDNPGNGDKWVAKIYQTDFSLLRKIIGSLAGNGNAARVNGDFGVVSPSNDTVVYTDLEKPKLYFADVNSNTVDDYASESEGTAISFSSDEKSVSDLKTTSRDVLAVAYTSSTQKGVTLYNLNPLTKIEDGDFTVSKTIKGLSMNPNGDVVVGYYGLNDGALTKFHLNDYSLKHYSDITKTSKFVFDDRVPNMTFTLEDDDGETTNAMWSLNSRVGSNNEFFDDWEDGSVEENTPYYSRRDFNLASDWKRLDLIGLPKGGAMVLYGKSDGSSMLEWIGRRGWPGNSANLGKYRLFAKWTNVARSSVSDGQNIPSDTYSTASNMNEIDEWSRVIIRCNKKLPEGHTIKQVKLSNKNLSFSNTRYITPVLLCEKDSTHFILVDYASPLTITRQSGDQTFNVNWKYGGLIGKNFYAGWWSGNSDNETTLPEGCIQYKENNSGSFIADVKYNNSVGAEGYPLSDAIKGNNSLTDNTDSGKKRDYSILFVTKPVTVTTDNFPPLYSKKLAMSPDMGTLAILSGDSSVTVSSAKDFPRIHYFDFNNQIYGCETQIEGMLVDYREDFQSGAVDASGNIVTPTRGWPEETESLFKCVTTEARFIEAANKINVLASATTHGDSWSSFNNYPGNYVINGTQVSSLPEPNKTKAHANKRFFGYLRPSDDIHFLQSFATDDIRLFLNNSLVAGRTTVWPTEPLSPVIITNIASESKSLFQIDQASNLGDNNLSVFKTSSMSLPDFSQNVPSSGGINKRISMNGGSKWGHIVSSETYILNNVPAHMLTLDAAMGSGSSQKRIPVASTTVMFSRNRAKPVLYASDSNNSSIWTFYNGLNNGNVWVRYNLNTLPSGSKISDSMAFSSDGQNLLLGVKGTNNEIWSYNIASCSESMFSSQQSKYESTTPASFMGKVGTVLADGAVDALATKPFTSYKSSKVGGEYRQIGSSDTNLAGASLAVPGSITVASGGIYIYGGGKNIVRYNPADGSSETISNALKKESPYSPITSYNNVIYVVGNNAGGSLEDPPTSRIQSFNPETGEALVSPDLTATDDSSGSFVTNKNSTHYKFGNMVSVTAGSTGSGNDPLKVFDGTDGDWNTDEESDLANKFYVTYDSTASTDPTSAFIVNKITINNKNVVYTTSIFNERDCGIKDFEFYGSNGSGFGTKLVSGTMPPNSEKSFTFSNTTAYKKYTIKGLSSYDSQGLSGGIRELTMYRDNVTLLTPSQSSSGTVSGKTVTFYTSNGNINIKWSSHKSSSYTGDKVFKNYNSSGKFTPNNGAWITEKSDSQPWMMWTFPQPVAATIFRYYTHDVHISAFPSYKDYYIKQLRIYGTNNDSKTADDFCNSGDGWTELGSYNEGRDIEGWITLELNNTQKYKYYLLRILDKTTPSTDGLYIRGLELYAEGGGVFAPPDILTENCLSPIRTDDNEPIKFGAGACCATPYGIALSGGHSGGENPNNLAMLYWPHAVNRYDGSYYQYGISRSLPALATKPDGSPDDGPEGGKASRFNHNMVWHKGKIYVIGGCIRADNSYVPFGKEDFIRYLDYNNKMKWEKIGGGKLILNNGVSDEDLKRYYHGMCSFGDEIFIFGGRKGGGDSDVLKTAIAYNPETGVIRKLADMPTALAPCGAVAYGSKIYIFGKVGGVGTLYEYTP